MARSPSSRARSGRNQSKKTKTLLLPFAAPKPVTVGYRDSPFKRRENIHPRRVLPRVREGRERQFHSVTTQTVFVPHALQAFGPQAATDELTLSINTTLPEPGSQQLASNVGEPSVAINGNVVVYTGNWYAARSIDGGQTFQFLDPFTAFPDPPNLGFCCDQVVNYIQSIDTFVWLLQYGPQAGPQADNIQRLAFSTTAEGLPRHPRPHP